MQLIPVAFTLLATAVLSSTAADVTYNVVSSVPNNTTIGVIVDSQVYPLSSSKSISSLLYTGKAPAAKNGYQYAIIQQDSAHTIVNQEPFSRSPVDTSSTLNEFYNRSWNEYQINKFPQVFEPLSIIHRIDSKLHNDGQIPVIQLTGNQTEIDNMNQNQYSEIDVKLKMTYIGLQDTKVIDDVTVAVSGYSTRSLAKLSYKLNIPKKQDLYGYRRLKLRSLGADISYMREKLVYSFTESIGMPSSGYSYVRVFLNDQPLGLFGLAEVTKNPWLRNEFADGKKYKQGAIWAANVNPKKAAPLLKPNPTESDSHAPPQNTTTSTDDYPLFTPPDLSFLSNNVTLYQQGQYDVKEDPSVGQANFTRIMEFTKFISEQSNTTVSDNATLWHQYVDVTSVIRGLALEIMVSNMDGYLAMPNNYLLYDDLENNRLVFSGSDFDLTMGTAVSNRDRFVAGDYTTFPGFAERPLVSRLLAVPEFKKEFTSTLKTMTTQLIYNNTLDTIINQYSGLLRDDVAWDRNLTRVGHDAVGNIFSEFPSFETVINGTLSGVAAQYSTALKEWVSLRSSNLMNYFNQTGI